MSDLSNAQSDDLRTIFFKWAITLGDPFIRTPAVNDRREQLTRVFGDATVTTAVAEMFYGVSIYVTPDDAWRRWRAHFDLLTGTTEDGDLVNGQASLWFDLLPPSPDADERFWDWESDLPTPAGAVGFLVAAILAPEVRVPEIRNVLHEVAQRHTGDNVILVEEALAAILARARAIEPLMDWRTVVAEEAWRAWIRATA